jgi:hypothetical protein
MFDRLARLTCLPATPAAGPIPRNLRQPSAASTHQASCWALRHAGIDNAEWGRSIVGFRRSEIDRRWGSGQSKAPGGFPGRSRYTVDPGALSHQPGYDRPLRYANRQGQRDKSPVTDAQRPSWSLEDLLSQPRLQPYRAANGGDLAAALELYQWNVEISACFYESLHYLEIGLRNAMDWHLERWAAGIGASQPWYRDPAVPLTGTTRKAIDKARGRATADGRPELHGRVTAELMLGFWWSLLADEYNRRLWQPCLQYAFDGSVRRRQLHLALDDLRRLRNRIAHHEPIHTRDLKVDYANLLDTSGRISPHLRAQIETTSRVRAVLARRPGPPANPEQS